MMNSHYQHNNDPKLIFCSMPKTLQKASFMKQKATKKGISTNKPNCMTVERKNIQVRGVNLTYGRWSWSAVVERCVRVQVQSDYLACHNLTESVALRKRLLSGVIISSLHNWSAHTHTNSLCPAELQQEPRATEQLQQVGSGARRGRDTRPAGRRGERPLPHRPFNFLSVAGVDN